MEKITEQIPVSLHKKLSEKLINVILSAEKRNAVSTDTAKKIIYLWRQDQLATPTGLVTLLDAAVMADIEETTKITDELGLNEVSVMLRN